ncbi:hypothetical protein K8B33_01145 [Alcanivorax sp. JB21]|nr:hypothetical protein [Alcanivorax limicola]
MMAGLLLPACGGSSGGGGSSQVRECGVSEGEINRAMLLQDRPRLSDYDLFQDHCNPTAMPRENGVRYELTSSLFSDYSSKYRFVFLPPGESATWDDTEAFEFPVGTVITKTFSMPADTAHPGFENERLLETRLLIRRDSGWVALPYIWNAAGDEATLRITGGGIPVSVVHDGAQRDFTYRVPDVNQCSACHQFRVNGSAIITLIGPRARSLNRDVDYGIGPQSQLAHWVDEGLLSDAPADLTAVDTVPEFSNADAALIPGMSDAQLLRHAKGYLDINCAHCHRPQGSASTSGLFLEFWRDFATQPTQHGVCKRPIAFGGGTLSYDIVPGDAAASILHYRMGSLQPGHSMPSLGKATPHTEGLALIGAWIDRMPASDCDGA